MDKFNGHFKYLIQLKLKRMKYYFFLWYLQKVFYLRLFWKGFRIAGEIVLFLNLHLSFFITEHLVQIIDGN
jgi:hypothetical protein